MALTPGKRFAIKATSKSFPFEDTTWVGFGSTPRVAMERAASGFGKLIAQRNTLGGEITINFEIVERPSKKVVA